MSTENTFKIRIEAALNSASSRAILSDAYVSWSAHQTKQKIFALEQWIRHNLPEGAYVGVVFANSAPQALVVLTLLFSNRVPVLLSPNDLSANPVQGILRNKLAALITLDGSEGPFFGHVPCLMLSLHGEIEREPVPFVTQKDSIAPQNTALVLQTSGSTGQPKNILVPKFGLLQTIDFLTKYFSLNRETVAPIMLSNHHSMALNTQFIPAFLAGGRCHFINPQMEIHRLFRNIINQKGNFVGLTSEMLLICNEERIRKSLPAANNVKHVQLAGGLITGRHLAMAQELFPNAIIHKGYGLTEAIRVTMIPSSDPYFNSPSVGYPLPFVKVEIRDGDKVLWAPDQKGEIHVKGPNVQVNLLSGPDSFLKTGDVGYWNDSGQLCVVGRQDGIIKINGERVSTHEIERMALESSDYIRNAACLAIDNGRRALVKLVLMLEVPPDLEIKFFDQDFANIQEKLFERFKSLPYFPKEIATIDRFPRTSNGKLAISALTTTYLNSKRDLFSKNGRNTIQFYKILSA
jgi:long-chain acyl-CoA synthetase